MYKRKKRILCIIRKSALTGKAVWVSHKRSYRAEWQAYKTACINEFKRMRRWAGTVNRRRRNVTKLLGELTARLPILGDITPEQRAAAKVLTQIANKAPSKQSDFYDHILEDRRQKNNARRRQKRWQEKYGAQNGQNTNYDK